MTSVDYSAGSDIGARPAGHGSGWRHGSSNVARERYGTRREARSLAGLVKIGKPRRPPVQEASECPGESNLNGVRLRLGGESRLTETGGDRRVAMFPFRSRPGVAIPAYRRRGDKSMMPILVCSRATLIRIDRHGT